MKRVIEAFGSGVVVYVIVAACGSGGGGGGPLDASAGAAAGSGGTSPWDALSDSVSWDAVSDPVPDAHAAPPLVQEAPCDIPKVYFNSTYYFAELAFPGRSQQELSLARAYLRPTQPLDLPASGYEWAAASDIFVKDGSVLVFCRLTFFNNMGVTARVVLPT